MGVGDDGAGCLRRDVVGKVRGLVGQKMHHAGRQVQIAVIGEHHRLPQQPADARQIGGVQLRQVQVHHIRLADELPGPVQYRWRHHPLADAQGHIQADHLHAIAHLPGRQGGIIARREHRHLVAAPSQGARQPLGIDRQPGIVRAVVGQGHQDVQCALDLSLVRPQPPVQPASDSPSRARA